MLQWPKNFKHALGQNFLRDERVLERIVECIAPQECDWMLEIGAGVGALTTRLLPRLTHLSAVEVDGSLIPLLRANCADLLSRLTIHQRDILNFALSELEEDDGSAKINRKLRIVGNLPYNISTPLIFHLLDEVERIWDMHFMLQKEVGERMVAQAGEAAYGRLSVMVQYYCEVQKLIDVPPSAFKPAPKVDSVVVRLVPRRMIERPAVDLSLLRQVVRESFSARRKTMRNALKRHLTSPDWEVVGIDAGLRPEQLTVDEYVAISNYLSTIRGKDSVSDG